MNEQLFLSISEVAEQIKEKKLSPVELTKETIKHIKKLDPTINAFISVFEEESLQQAKLFEEEISTGNYRGPLHGVPISIKDIIQVKDAPTTSGSKIFENWIPSEDATVVEKLKEAGAIIIGKNNMHEFAMGATSENPHYGVIRNPWNLEKIPGGSSGGSGASVASGMSFASIGTDTAGSIRLPAAMCGVVGIKPTYGVVSKYGCLPFSWSLDHIGPLTRTVKDAATILNIIAGNDKKDPSTVKETYNLNLDKERKDLSGVTIGLCESYFFDDIDESIQVVIEDAVKQLKKLGATLKKVDLPMLDEALHAQRMIAQSEVLAFHQPWLEKNISQYGEDLQFRFDFGKKITALDYINAQRYRTKCMVNILETIKDIDVLVGPTNTKQPYTIGSVGPKEAINNMFTLGKTPLANILGLPSLTVPCGLTKDKLPVGLQFIGKPLTDKLILEIGDCYEKSISWNDLLKQHITNTIHA